MEVSARIWVASKTRLPGGWQFGSEDGGPSSKVPTPKERVERGGGRFPKALKYLARVELKWSSPPPPLIARPRHFIITLTFLRLCLSSDVSQQTGKDSSLATMRAE